jgi:hypothetical protein
MQTINDELVNRVKVLTKALFEAEKAFNKLQQENEILSLMLSSIRSDNEILETK